MSIEIINPTDKKHWLECRTKDITSTEISALFGFSPYMTEFELWHQKKSGTVVEIKGNERMKWGTALQDAIAAEVAKEQGWTIRRMDEYMRNTDLRAGASFDFSIESKEICVCGKPIAYHNRPEADQWVECQIPRNSMNQTKDYGLLEIKNVDSLAFRDGWTEDEAGNIEAPLHIEIQVQHQLMVSGRSFAYIGALVGGNRLVLIKRERNEAVITSIKIKIKEFWASIEASTPPKPNFSKDAAFIASMYRYAEPNKVFDARGNESFIEWAREHKRLGDIAKDCETKRDALKAQMLIMIGDAEKVLGDEFSISLGMVSDSVKMISDLTPAQLAGEEPVSKRAGYRNFRTTWRKQK